jgi:hypothetical protein
VGLWRLLRRIPADDRLIIGWVLAIKVLLLIFGAKAYRIFENQPLPESLGWLKIWDRWDSGHYQRLAQFGYEADSILKAWFYPLFPWTVRVAGRLCDDYLAGAFLVSSVASVCAALLLFRLVRLDFSPAIARQSVCFFLIFPTAHFLHIGYTESLFLALALGSILAAQTGRWELAALLGALAWMTRANGIVLLPTLAVAAAHQYWVTRRWNWRWLWIALIPAGFGVYLLVNWQITGDPFSFWRTRMALFAAHTSWPWVGINGAIGNLRRSPNQAEMVGTQELLFLALGLVCAVISWFKMRPVHAMWITASWVLFSSVSFLQSTPRYTLSMYPIFILFALAARHPFWRGLITVWSLLFLALFASLFVRGWWAF